jgi:hypothetical protein
MKKELANFFFDETARIFVFLVNEYSFAPPQLKIDDEIHFAFVTFVGKNLAFECILDERESDVTCGPKRYPSAGRSF